MNWKNKTIFIGDNLDIMKGMNSESVDLIYLDPPFNSNQNYSAPIGSKAAGAAFKDAWTFDDIKQEEYALLAYSNDALYKLISASGATHDEPMMAYLIIMSSRLMEMKRLLKETGSIYLHCDPTAGHYLKLAMDAIFGPDNFRNEIIWERIKGTGKTSQYGYRSFGRASDTILFYSKSDHYVFELERLAKPYAPKDFPNKDEKGHYKRRSPFRPPGLGPRPNLCYEYKGIYPPNDSGWTVKKSKLEELDNQGELEWVSRTKVWRKQRPGAGVLPNNIWIDVPFPASERTGFPTQKPLALLNRIIKASSNEGEVVFDPFCGCATTLVAADRLRRKWIGIDLSPMAGKLVVSRIKDDQGLFQDITHRTDVPTRTDGGGDQLVFPPPTPKNPETYKPTLFGEQKGRCGACGSELYYRQCTIDHKVPRTKGGTNEKANLWLLCGWCNSVKGDRPITYLRERLVEEGIIRE